MAADSKPLIAAHSIGAQRVHKRLLLVALVCGGAAASALILHAAPTPFFWLWLTWAVVCFVAIGCVSRDWQRSILLFIGLLSCLLACLEVYLSSHEYRPPIYPDGGYILPDSVLGWAPPPGIRARAISRAPDGLFHHSRGTIFDVTYTIDSSGLRVAPPYRKDELAGTILFFGCSFTVGEGLPDNETLPYQTGALSDGRYRTFNFAFHAYGANQMLAAIEHGRVEKIVDGGAQEAFYVAIPDHVWRVAGKVPWGGNAPRYVLAADGSVVQHGVMKDQPTLADRLHLKHGVRQLNKWALWRAISNPEGRITPDDIRLYLAVVERSREDLEAQFPGIRFRILLWPPQDTDAQHRRVYEQMRDGFQRMQIPTYLVQDALPGYSTDREKYILSTVDRHPNALADQILAQYVLQLVARK